MENRSAIGDEPEDAFTVQTGTTVLQTKLYQTAKQNPKRRFHQLYDKLYRADVLRDAWDQVRRNGGAPGSDGATIEAILETGVEPFLDELGQALREQTYQPQPVRRVEIPKSPGKIRLLGIPSIRDRVVQAALKQVIEPIFEADFEETSYGFRPGIGQPEALASVQRSAFRGFRWVVDADIEGFFDYLDHQRLMTALRRRLSDGAVLRLIYRMLKAGILVGCVFQDSDEGVPQGGVASPLLANIYLHTLDVAVREQKEFIGGYTRFADDFVIQCGSRQHAERALRWVQAQLEGLGLRLNTAKTRIINDEEAGFDFLGFHHRRVPALGRPDRPKKSMRWPSRKACQKFRDRFRALLRETGYVQKRAQWENLHRRVNAYLRGFGSYFRNGQSSQVLHKLDLFAREALSRHLARSQPRGKGRRKRRWWQYAAWLDQQQAILEMERAMHWSVNSYRGQANLRWKAV